MHRMLIIFAELPLNLWDDCKGGGSVYNATIYTELKFNLNIIDISLQKNTFLKLFRFHHKLVASLSKMWLLSEPLRVTLFSSYDKKKSFVLLTHILFFHIYKNFFLSCDKCRKVKFMRACPNFIYFLSPFKQILQLNKIHEKTNFQQEFVFIHGYLNLNLVLIHGFRN